MPALERKGRTQWAVVWDLRRHDQDGDPVVSLPREIRVRWEWGERQMADARGNKVTVDAQAVVAEDIAVGSLMFEGLLEDWLGTGSGGTDSLLMEVVAADFVPDLKGRNMRRTLGLAWFRDTMPTTE